MTTQTEALKLALEAMELVNIEFVCNGAHHAKKDRHSLDEDCPVTMRYRTAITAIKEALAQTQEPVAWQLWVGADTPLNAPMGWQFYSTYDSLKSAEITARTINSYQQAPFAKIVPLYPHPPQRTWVGLTEQEHTDIAVECGCRSADWVFYGAAVERKLKEKNFV